MSLSIVSSDHPAPPAWEKGDVWAGLKGCMIPVGIVNMMLMVRVKDPASLTLAPCDVEVWPVFPGQKHIGGGHQSRD